MAIGASSDPTALESGVAGAGAAALPPPLEIVRYSTVDHYPITADYYRSPARSAEAAVLFPAADEPRSVWRPLAEALRGAGFHVLCPDLRGVGDSRPASGAPGRSVGDWGHAERDGIAALAFLEERLGRSPARIVWIGRREGAEVAARSALFTPEEGSVVRVLFDPLSDLAGERLLPLLQGRSGPILVLADRAQQSVFDTALTCYLELRPECRFWQLGQEAGGSSGRLSNAGFCRDLAAWLAELERTHHQPGSR